MSQSTNNVGREFEKEFAKEFGLELIPGSGNQWYSKLDVMGRGARWSLKATEKNSASISKDTIEEAILACTNMSGDMTIPLWAFKIGNHEMVMMRKEDFKSWEKKELIFTEDKKSTNLEERKARASTPRLLRNG